MLQAPVGGRFRRKIGIRRQERRMERCLERLHEWAFENFARVRFRASEMAASDKWLADCDGCDRLCRELSEKIERRDKDVKNGKNFSQANVELRVLLKKLDGNVKDLKGNLLRSVSSSQITAMEGNRRQAMLDSLVSKQAQLETAFSGKHATQVPGRTSLLGDDFGRPRGAVSWAGAEESDDITEDFSVADVRSQQQRVIKEQDDGLEALSSVIARQKQLAYAIGDEADLHNELIDDITDHVDRTRDRLLKETRHVQIVDRKSNTCWFWIVIILLLISIIVIVAIPFKK